MEIPSKNGRYYPVPFRSEQIKAKKYLKLFPKNSFSIGRAGTYRYEVDIDDCIWQALEIKKIISQDKWNGPVIGEEYKNKLVKKINTNNIINIGLFGKYIKRIKLKNII